MLLRVVSLKEVHHAVSRGKLDNESTNGRYLKLLYGSSGLLKTGAKLQEVYQTMGNNKNIKRFILTILFNLYGV